MPSIDNESIFVCYTPFHILVSLLLARSMHAVALILGVDHFYNGRLIASALQRHVDWIGNVYAIEDKRITANWIRGNTIQRAIAMVRLKKMYSDCAPELKNIQASERTRWYLFHDGPMLSQYLLNLNLGEYLLIEDGAANYRKLKWQDMAKNMVKSIIGLFPPMGRSSRINKILVQEPERLPKDIRHKGMRLCLQELMFNVKENDKLIILRKVFPDLSRDISHGISGHKVLLLTQPFSEDGLMSEDEKISLYSRVLQRYPQSHICLKPHPRERTDYQSVFGNQITIIPREFPLEILSWYDNVNFDLVITWNSSAINNIGFAKEKLRLDKA
ncbi:hypothetical protein MHOCP_06840 [Moorella humiferrea]|uniref:glycosyltransferase family 52 n=1 Tax=Neomoorella humiferrea TaxID=676965 RepID=UPI0030D2DAF7